MYFRFYRRIAIPRVIFRPFGDALAFMLIQKRPLPFRVLFWPVTVVHTWVMILAALNMTNVKDSILRSL